MADKTEGGEIVRARLSREDVERAVSVANIYWRGACEGLDIATRRLEAMQEEAPPEVAAWLRDLLYSRWDQSPRPFAVRHTDIWDWRRCPECGALYHTSAYERGSHPDLDVPEWYCDCGAQCLDADASPNITLPEGDT